MRIIKARSCKFSFAGNINLSLPALRYQLKNLFISLKRLPNSRILVCLAKRIIRRAPLLTSCSFTCCEDQIRLPHWAKCQQNRRIKGLKCDIFRARVGLFCRQIRSLINTVVSIVFFQMMRHFCKNFGVKAIWFACWMNEGKNVTYTCYTGM